MGSITVFRRASYRLFAVSLCFTLVYSSASTSMNSVLTAISKIAVNFQGEPPFHTETPGPVDPGPNPAVDPDYRSGIWDDELRIRLGDMQYYEGTDSTFPEALPEPADPPSGAQSRAFGAGDPSPYPGIIGNPYSGKHNWEALGPGGGSPGAPGGVNTNTGNRMTVVPLVSYPIRGGMSIDLTLYHNSRNEGLYSAGYAWRTSFDFTVYQDPSPIIGARTAIVQWPDGTYVPYKETFAGSNIYASPLGVYEKLQRVYGQGWRIVTKDQITYWFSTTGLLTSIVDRSGNTITVGRVNGRLSYVSDPQGHRLYFSANGNGRIGSVMDELSRTWTFSYSAGNDLIGISYPILDGTIYTRSFVYDANHNITQESDLRGNTWTQGYDANQRLAWFKNPLQNQTSYAYFGARTSWTLPLGQEEGSHYYSGGLLVSDKDSAGFSNGRTYDVNRRVVTLKDKGGFFWYYAFDASGNVLNERRPGEASPTRFYTYNTFNDLISFSCPSSTSNKWLFGRDAVGRLTSVTAPGNLIVAQFGYDTYGQRTWAKDGMLRQTDYVYDTFGRMTSVDPPGAGAGATCIAYDALHRPTSVTDPLNNVTSVTYDNWGRAILAVNPDSSSVSAQYDREDNVTLVTDELGHASTVTYDSACRKTQVVNARGDIETFGYNANDWLVSSTNGRGYVQSLTYTNRGELWKLVMPDGATEYSSYGGRGNQTAYTNPLGNVIQYVHSQVGNLATVDYPTGTDTQLTYDALNRVATLADSTGTTTWTRNTKGWLTGLSTSPGNLSYTYNDAGQRLTMTAYSEGTTNYTYDTSGRLATLRNGLNETTTFEYDLLSRITKRTLSSTAKEEYTFDSRSRPTSITLKKNNNQLLSSQSYTYDAVGNVLTHTQDGVTTTYGYDAIDQILSESRTGYSAAYTYDGNGNRLTKTLNTVQEVYAYDPGDKLIDVRVGGVSVKTYGYDAAGRTTSVVSAAGTTNLAYDFEDRLTSISGGGVPATGYTYNGLDTRVSRSGSSNQTFKRDGAFVTDPVLNDGLAGFTPGISERRSGTTTFSHAGLKNNAVQSSTTQTITAAKTYDAFGLLATSSGTWKGPFSYGGPFEYQEDSESGLKLLGHRYYDASTGRFLTRDPIRSGSNWYSYCYNNPIKSVDPLGLESVGHHIVPNELTKAGQVSDEAQRVFDSAVTGPIPGGHGNSKPHMDYTARVKSMLEDFCQETGIDPKRMTAKQARQFVERVLNSKDKIVRQFLTDIYSKIGKGIPKVFDDLGETAVKRILRKLGKKAIGTVLRKVPFVGIGFFGYDWISGGFGHAANELLWPLSELWGGG